MRSKNKYIKFLLIYIAIIVIMITFTKTKYMSIYNKVTIIDDREIVLSKTKDTVPIKIEFYSDKWGKGLVTESKDVRHLWNMINNIPKRNQCVQKGFYDATDKIQGKIFYLNGRQDSLSIGNTIRINDYVYGTPKDRSDINYIINYLYEKLYSCESLAFFINEVNRVTLSRVNGNEMNLGSYDKSKVRESIKNSKKVSDIKEFNNIMQNKGKMEYHLKVYLEKEEGNVTLKKNYLPSIINVDIYESGYFVVTDLENENGNLIHMKGDINEVCHNIKFLK